jgi:hypothetical protein
MLLELGEWFYSDILAYIPCYDDLGNGWVQEVYNNDNSKVFLCLANIFEVQENEILPKSARVDLQTLFSNQEVSIGFPVFLHHLVLILFMHIIGMCHAWWNSTIIHSDYLVVFKGPPPHVKLQV